MKRTRLIFGVLPLVFVVFMTHARGESPDKLQGLKRGTTIRIGVEAEGDWPPYEFFQREDGKVTDKVVGFNVDVLEEIFPRHGLQYEFKKYPWKRCLAYLETGRELQMVMSTSLNMERRRKYLVSRLVYTITPHYFYLKKHYPDGLQITRAEELTELGTVCGRRGYNYVNFGIANDEVYRGAADYQALIQMTKTGRCDIFLARYEILAASFLTGASYLTEDIGHAPIPGVTGEDFHFLISKNYEHGEALLQIVDQGLDRLRHQGRLKAILKKYLP